MSSSWMQAPPLRLQAKQPVQYSMCLSITSMIWISCGAASRIPSRNARVTCMVSLLSRLGLPLKTSIFTRRTLLLLAYPHWIGTQMPHS